MFKWLLQERGSIEEVEEVKMDGRERVNGLASVGETGFCGWEAKEMNVDGITKLDLMAWEVRSKRKPRSMKPNYISAVQSDA
ncbi:Scopoletin glucosyltransferase [Senna tora]|uniref:Scopoletin glucosyltransferase n=1 Tax=Senna tora TaxID=362788 RepID=A0A834SVP9_9FABA|nr:Scopoletin glucosyltransferase [Senna tora]